MAAKKTEMVSTRIPLAEIQKCQFGWKTYFKGVLFIFKSRNKARSFAYKINTTSKITL
jgi:hypothetical protein